MTTHNGDGGWQQVTEIGYGDYVVFVKDFRSGDVQCGGCNGEDREPNLSSETGLSSSGCNCQNTFDGDNSKECALSYDSNSRLAGHHPFSKYRSAVFAQWDRNVAKDADC